MTPKELADSLSGCTHGYEISNSMERKMMENGLVAVFYGSKNIVEFHGAICNGFAFLGKSGVNVGNISDVIKVKDIFTSKKTFQGSEIWSFSTDIPHETFLVFEYDETVFCEGIVFSIDKYFEVMQ